MEFTAKTVEEAVELGLKELGLSQDQAEINVLEQPVKGLFGKLKGKAVVEINKIQSNTEKATTFIQSVLDIMDITAKAQFNGDEENPVITLIAEDSANVIGYRGEILDALQTLAGSVANIGNKTYKKVVVDCENYRSKREETLIALAKKLEGKATEMRREVTLEPMNPFERRIIHTALVESQTVTTKSEGAEPNRYVVIVPNDLDEFSKPYNAGRNNGAKKGDRKDGRKGKKDFNSKKGFNKNSKPMKRSGFTEQRKKTSTGFGTYLGNSLKDNF